ncbi:MAG TPA: hypothetical protein VE758_02115 [Chthoniobacterales bacterium]|nr:hypothetical protein [Chthoniobacterales bacterium]
MNSLSDLLRPRRYFALRAKRKRKARAFGMTSWHEQDWLRTYAARTYHGRGAIVDLGCFLGATTIALAEGLTLNPRPPSGAVIHAYDLFSWGKGFELWAKGKEVEGQIPLGGSFRPEFLKRIARWRDYIVVHEEDLARAQWQNGPIEFLLIDAMKTAETASAITHAFFPDVIPATGYVAHQDFAHAYTPWIHLIAYRLRDYFSLTADVPSSGTMVFRCERQLPLAAVDMDVLFSTCSTSELEAAFDYSLGLVRDEKKGNIIAAKAMAYRERGQIVRAREILAATGDSTPSLAGELEQIKRLIAAEAKERHS